MPKDLFYESIFTIQYTLGNKIMAIILANTGATRYNFIDEEFIEIICQVLEIKPQYLIKPKQIQRFDSRTAKPITHAIYFTLIFDIYTESFAFLLVINLENYLIILS